MADVLVDSQRRVLISGYGYGYGVGGGLPPQPAESLLLGRLDQIDLRLRQLEEQQQQQRPPSHSHADHGAPVPAPALRAPAAQPQHQHTKSLPTALQQQHVQVRGDLMDRLNLLESRIRQLSCELGLDCGRVAGGKAVHHHQLGFGLGLGSSSSVPPVEDPATWSDSAPVAVVEPAFGGGKVQSKPVAADGGGSWSAVEILQRCARQLHRSTSSISGISKPNPPTKVKKLKEAKCACQKEKAKAERKSLTKAERSKSLMSRLWFMVGSGCKP